MAKEVHQQNIAFASCDLTISVFAVMLYYESEFLMHFSTANLINS